MNDPSPIRLSLPTCDLHVEFFWKHDRFAHRFLSAGDVLMNSCEGDPDAPWPPSPPLQQLSRESIHDGYAILAVGAAGRGHWSLSATVIATEDEPAIHFDLACRTKEDPLWIGSTYRQSRRLEIAPGPHSRLHQEQDNQVQIAPVDSATDPTIRWCYRVSLAKKP